MRPRGRQRGSSQRPTSTASEPFGTAGRQGRGPRGPARPSGAFGAGAGLLGSGYRDATRRRVRAFPPFEPSEVLCGPFYGVPLRVSGENRPGARRGWRLRRVPPLTLKDRREEARRLGRGAAGSSAERSRAANRRCRLTQLRADRSFGSAQCRGKLFDSVPRIFFNWEIFHIKPTLIDYHVNISLSDITHARAHTHTRTRTPLGDLIGLRLNSHMSHWPELGDGCPANCSMTSLAGHSPHHTLT